MAKALSGVRVLDLSRVRSGPWASQTLADPGAEVIETACSLRQTASDTEATHR
jgi:crotonobetainyl-CoA:carnitine CoA-transferase CaiB-like acyl-CoA transferase